MVPETMNAVVLTDHGGLDELDYRKDVPLPRLAPDDVLVEVGACGLNNTDIWTRNAAYGDEGGWKGNLDFPIIQGADMAGTIADVGAGVSPDRIGERVLVDNALYADAEDEFQSLVHADLVGSERDGGYAEYASVPAVNAHRIDSDCSDAELATFPTSYVTAERMLNRADVGPGETILVTGASGGVGTGLVQLAQRRDADVVALTSSEKRDDVRGLGVETAIARDEVELSEAVDARLENGQVDVVADVVGGEMFQQLLEMLRPGGRLVTAGAIADPVATVDLRTIYLEQLDVVGSTMGTRSEFEDLVRYIETGEIRPLLADTYPLSDIHAAQRQFVESDYLGNIVVLP